MLCNGFRKRPQTPVKFHQEPHNTEPNTKNGTTKDDNKSDDIKSIIAKGGTTENSRDLASPNNSATIKNNKSLLGVSSTAVITQQEHQTALETLTEQHHREIRNLTQEFEGKQTRAAEEFEVRLAQELEKAKVDHQAELVRQLEAQQKQNDKAHDDAVTEWEERFNRELELQEKEQEEKHQQVLASMRESHTRAVEALEAQNEELQQEVGRLRDQVLFSSHNTTGVEDAPEESNNVILSEQTAEFRSGDVEDDVDERDRTSSSHNSSVSPQPIPHGVPDHKQARATNVIARSATQQTVSSDTYSNPGGGGPGWSVSSSRQRTPFFVPSGAARDDGFGGSSDSRSITITLLPVLSGDLDTQSRGGSARIGGGGETAGRDPDAVAHADHRLDNNSPSAPSVPDASNGSTSCSRPVSPPHVQFARAIEGHTAGDTERNAHGGVADHHMMQRADVRGTRHGDTDEESRCNEREESASAKNNVTSHKNTAGSHHINQNSHSDIMSAFEHGENEHSCGGVARDDVNPDEQMFKYKPFVDLPACDRLSRSRGGTPRLGGNASSLSSSRYTPHILSGGHITSTAGMEWTVQQQAGQPHQLHSSPSYHQHGSTGWYSAPGARGRAVHYSSPASTATLISSQRSTAANYYNPLLSSSSPSSSAAGTASAPHVLATSSTYPYRTYPNSGNGYSFPSSLLHNRPHANGSSVTTAAYAPLATYRYHKSLSPHRQSASHSTVTLHPDHHHQYPLKLTEVSDDSTWRGTHARHMPTHITKTADHPLASSMTTITTTTLQQRGSSQQATANAPRASSAHTALWTSAPRGIGGGPITSRMPSSSIYTRSHSNHTNHYPHHEDDGRNSRSPTAQYFSPSVSPALHIAPHIQTNSYATASSTMPGKLATLPMPIVSPDTSAATSTILALSSMAVSPARAVLTATKKPEISNHHHHSQYSHQYSQNVHHDAHSNAAATTALSVSASSSAASQTQIMMKKYNNNDITIEDGVTGTNRQQPQQNRNLNKQITSFTNSSMEAEQPGDRRLRELQEEAMHTGRPFLGIDIDRNLIVTKVHTHGPGYNAGLQAGDEVVAVSGRAIRSKFFNSNSASAPSLSLPAVEDDYKMVIETMRGLRVGEVIRLQIRRGGSVVDTPFSVTALTDDPKYRELYCYFDSAASHHQVHHGSSNSHQEEDDDDPTQRTSSSTMSRDSTSDTTASVTLGTLPLLNEHSNNNIKNNNYYYDDHTAGTETLLTMDEFGYEGNEMPERIEDF